MQSSPDKPGFLRKFSRSVLQFLARIVGSDIVSWDLLFGILLGAGMGFWAKAKSGILAEESTVLLTVSGAAVGLLAATLATMALLMGFLSGFYKLVVEKEGVRSFFRPFKIVASVSAGAIIAGLAGALDSGPGPRTLQPILFGIAVALFVWAVVGVVQLVRIFIEHGYEQQKLNAIMAGGDSLQEGDDTPEENEAAVRRLAGESSSLARLGRYDDALAAIGESVNIFRDLANAFGSRYRSDLIVALDDIAGRYGETGPETPDALTARASLSSWIGLAGDAARARDRYSALLSDRQRVLGADHPDTLATRAQLAYWTGQAGDPAAARDQYSALLSDRQRVLGADHPDTLATRAQLAYWTGQAGDPAAARDQYSALLSDRQRVLGADHPDTLATRARLAYWANLVEDGA
jgi:tetratricopeptide (TPR) repeat protein